MSGGFYGQEALIMHPTHKGGRPVKHLSQNDVVQIEALAARQDSSGTLAGITCPTLIIGSMNDELCPVKEQERMHRLVRGGRLELLSGCGHFSLLEKPTRVNGTIEDWYGNL